MNDPHLWLESLESLEAKTWVNERNQESSEYFAKNKFYLGDQKDFSEVILSDDRLPLLENRKDYFYNVWKNVDHKQGLYRRIKVSDFASGNEDWEIILDLDELSKNENRTWVLSHAQYFKDNSRALLALSDGGSDAIFWREFDLEKKNFGPGYCTAIEQAF